MGIISFFIDWLRSCNIDKTNNTRRGITYYRPSQVGGFIETNAYNDTIVCSGGTPELRSEMISALCVVATNAGIPVIILHQGDSVLQQKLSTVYNGHPAYVEIKQGGYSFDPFQGLKNQQISKIIIDTAPERYSLTSNGGAYIDVLTGFLSERGYKVSLSELASCPFSNLPSLISMAAAKNILAPTIIQELQVNLAQGQPEARKVKAYLDELFSECSTLLPSNSASGINSITLPQAISKKAVLNFDIVSESNILLSRIIAEELKLLQRNRYMFYLVLDNIPINDDNSFKSLCSLKSGGFHCAICGDDFYSLCNGEDKLFSTFLGSSQKWFVFFHSSGISADKWSNAFAKYKKIETTTTYGRGKGGGWGLGLPLFGKPFISFNNNNHSQQGVSYADKDEFIIRPEEIQRLSDRSGYIYSAAKREIAFVKTFLP